MAEKVAYRVTTKKVVKPVLPQEETPGQYPSDWFDNHKGEKPRLVIPYKHADVGTLRGVVYGGIQKDTLDIKVAITYLYAVMVKLEVECDDEWKSFGVLIAGAKTTVNPFCMVEVESKQLDLPNQQAGAATEEDDLWMCFYILVQYRLLKVNNVEYEKLLVKRANVHLASLPGAKKSEVHSRKVYAAWLANPMYLRIVAAVDMFFHKFKEHPYAICRYGTLGSRYKDSAALTTLNHITKLTGLQIVDFMMWIFNDNIADELDRMARPDQELEKCDSYTPYMRDLGISDRSPYSAQMNPTFHMFCHALGTLLGSRRSMNARIAGEVDVTNTLTNAEVVAFILNRCPTFVKAYTEDLESVPTAQHKAVAGKMPTGPDPDMWFEYLAKLNFVLPDEIIRFAKERASGLSNIRPDTIGELVYKQLK
ncbi:nucleoprotein [Nkolbisson virus]|uniref:Nucleoprotein n=1 Tax=Nkolbisson virus TaxID=380442 RepID=A0A0D3R205_9RHAB|nr:nucleoprotein [Nkolbisson virus]AJR28542.1 nucleoprotein [Nkolbisson virus]